MQSVRKISLLLVAIFVGAVFGCSTLDKLSPKYASLPATKGATSQPAQSRDVAGQVGDVASKAGPIISAVPVPYASLIGGLVTILGTSVLSIDQMIRKNKHKATAEDLQAQLDELNASPAGTPDDPLHAVIVSPPKAA